MPTDKQVGVFLSVIGANTYGLLWDLLVPAKPVSKSIKELTKVLESHYKPKPLVIAQRYHFNKRNQGATESIADYVAALRKLSTNCEFGG